MRAVVTTKHGGPGVLQVQERPDPSLGAGEVRIDVAAAGINFADVMARLGLYPDAPKPPCVVGYEVAGTILELGEGSSRPQPRPARHRGHAVRRLRLAGRRPRRRRAPLPDGLTFEQGAAIPVNYGTAGPLLGFGSLLRGERVLIHSAGGGVGIAATQIAKRQAPRCTGRPRPASTRGSPSSASITRSTTPSPAGSAAAAVRRDHGRRRWRELPDALCAARRRAPDRLRRLRRRLRRAAQPRHGAAAPSLRMPRFNMIKQMSESKAVIGLNMLTCGRTARRSRPGSGRYRK